MNTIIFFLAIVVLGLVIMAKIPGLEHMVRPSIDLIFTAIKALAENSVSWFIWLFKNVWKSHAELLTHLFLPASKLDPMYDIKVQNGEQEPDK